VQWPGNNTYDNNTYDSRKPKSETFFLTILCLNVYLLPISRAVDFSQSRLSRSSALESNVAQIQRLQTVGPRTSRLRLGKENGMNQPSVPPWKTLLARKTAEHYRRFHSGTLNLTRRGFLSTTAGATGLLAASQFAFSTQVLADEDAKATAEPNPIPGAERHSASMFITIRSPMIRRYLSLSSTVRRVTRLRSATLTVWSSIP
jgi:hypothetical protein